MMFTIIFIWFYIFFGFCCKNLLLYFITSDDYSLSEINSFAAVWFLVLIFWIFWIMPKTITFFIYNWFVKRKKILQARLSNV